MRGGIGRVLAAIASWAITSWGCAAGPAAVPGSAPDPAPAHAPPSSFAGPVRAEPARGHVGPVLHPIALREGAIGLASVGGRAHALIDGEPIPLVAGQVPTRATALGLGLEPDKTDLTAHHELLAFGGELGGPLGAQLVYAERGEYGPATIAHYVHDGAGWQGRALPSSATGRGREVWVESYWSAFVVRDGMLLGLRRHRLRGELWDYGDGDEDLTADLVAAGRALSQAPRGFERLAGAKRPIPRLPKGWDARAAVGATDGLLVALGFRPARALDGDEGPARLLVWAPDSVDASVVELPGLPDPAARDLGLWASEATLLVGGLRDLPGAADQPYLAMREPDGGWSEVELDLPGVRERISSATASPAGELWIVTGTRNYASEAPCPCLWRRPVGERRWQAVELDPLVVAADAEPRWAHVRPRWAHVRAEPSWLEIPPASRPRLYPAAREVVWAEGSVWVTAELGRAYPGAAEPVIGDPRMVVYGLVATPTLAELPATDRLFDERYDRWLPTGAPTPGGDRCESFTLVLAGDPDDRGRDAAATVAGQVDRLAAAARVDDDVGGATASLIYVGMLDGRSELVADAHAASPGSAAALADAFAAALGWRPTLDCRPRTMVRPIARLP